MKALNNKGFAVAEVLIVAVIITLVAVIGYKVINKKSSITDNSTPTAQTSSSIPSKIKSKTDAKTAATALDQTPIDSQLDPTQLDNSIKSLL